VIAMVKPSMVIMPHKSTPQATTKDIIACCSTLLYTP
jgi:hypothetical protein